MRATKIPSETVTPPSPAGCVCLRFSGSVPTRLVERYAAHPLAVQRPVYADPSLPGVPWVYLLTTGAGVLAGDRLRVDLLLEDGAHAVVGTVGATRLHPGRARMDVRVKLGPGTVLEWMPDPLLPFSGCRFGQTVDVVAAPTSVYLAGEVLLLGREAAGERLAFDRLDLRWRLHTPGGGPVVAAEHSRLEPRRLSLDGPGALGGHAAVGTFRAVADRVPAGKIVRVLRSALAAHPDVTGGASELPWRAGAVARVLGTSGQAVTAALQSAWDASRHILLDVPAPPPRRH